MKQRNAHIPPCLTRMGFSLIASVVAGTLTLSAQTIPNPSFEADTFTVFPGYINGNTPITGWTGTPDTRVGLNPGGGSPFANNGTVPDGANVAFLQSNEADPATGSSLSTTITGLAPGTTYKLTLRVNARQNGDATTQTPYLRVKIDGTEIIALTVYRVGTANPYSYLAAEFTATAASQQLSLVNDQAGDNTVLVDDIKIAPSGGRWTIAPWTDDSMVDPAYFYSHAYNFNNPADVVVNGVTFKGVGGGNPAVAGQFTTTYLDSQFNGDANNVTLSGYSSGGLATDFLYHGGPISGGAFQGITLQGLTPGTEYLVTVFSMGWEDPTLDTRWVTFSVGEDRITVNQDQYGNDNGLLVSHRYVADASGSITVKIIPFNPSNVSFHVYAFANRRTTSSNVAPVITQQPSSVVVSEGTPATFSVAATGLPAPTFQWRFNGVNISGANGATYTIDTPTAANAGAYDVVVANVAGTVTSAKAQLTVGLAMNNPSFEVDFFFGWPGYVSLNGPITGWDSLPNHGINPVQTGAPNPFADNGIVPHGLQVAFMQGDGPLSQTVNGLTVGDVYYVHYYENARGPGATSVPAVEVKVGGVTVLPTHIVRPVGSGPYHEMYTDQFNATGPSALLEFIKSNPLGFDSTALIDNVAVVPVPAGSAPFVSRQPQTQAVSVGETATFSGAGIGTPPLSYQWLRNGAVFAGKTDKTLVISGVQTPDAADFSLKISNAYGAVTSAIVRLAVLQPIPDLYNTGVDANRAPLPTGAPDPHFTLTTNPDNTGTVPVVEGPIPSPPWLPNTAASQWIGPKANTSDSAIGAFTYRTVIDLTGRDPKTVYIEGRWAVDNAGADILVNGVSTGNPNNGGFGGFTSFTLSGTNINFVAGPNTLDFVVENVAAIGYTGLRLEFTKSNVEVPPGVPPSFTSHPFSKDALENASVTFSASVTGSSPMTYQWHKNGVPLPGKTDLTLTIPSVQTSDVGSYTIAVTNLYGFAISQPAALTITWRVVPGVAFGTGVNPAGTLEPAGTVDAHYILATSADPIAPGPSAYVLDDVWPVAAGVWLLNGPDSKWIAPQMDQSATATGGNLGGEYRYQTSFNLTGQDVSQMKIEGAWAVDNSGTVLLLNGVNTGFTSPGFSGWTPFTLTTGLNAGPNTLDFVVNNAPSPDPLVPNPTGLRVDLKAYTRINPLVTLSAKLQGGNLSVSWSPSAAGQKLQSAVNLTGPWTDLTGAANPFSTNVNSARLFFRIAQ